MTPEKKQVNGKHKKGKGKQERKEWTERRRGAGKLSQGGGRP